MDRSTPIYLIKEISKQDESGVFSTSECKRKVFASVNSISQNEWFQGGRNGLNPSLKFSMFVYDYDNEEVLEYESKRYAVYRTYRTKNDEIELYTELKKGREDGKKS